MGHFCIHGKAPLAQTVEDGKKATKPSDLTESGWTFGCWYKEAGCTNAFDFATPITADITLYAKWTPAGGSGGGVPVVPVILADSGSSGEAGSVTPAQPAADDTQTGTTIIDEEETPLYPGNNNETKDDGAKTASKKFKVIKIKSKAVLAKITAKYKKLFTKDAYKIKLYKSGAAEKIEVRLQYKKAVKGYVFYIADIKTGKRYKAKYDKKKKELVFKTATEGSYAVLKKKVKNK